MPEFEGDVQGLKAFGIAVVFSAGNGGPSPASSISPANYPDSFAVGSIDDTLSIAYDSSRGPSACDETFFPQVVAPGVNVRTSDLTFGAFPDSYTSVSGTSFAAPHVAGAMALLLDGVPGATVSNLESVLENSALDLGDSGPDNDFGYGLVDCVEAYNLLINMDPCTDVDGDGYYGEANCTTSLDCNDTDPGINPGACDIKRDGIDQDCDGRDRTRGKTCPGSGDSGGDPGDTGGKEGKGKTCSDGQDNDGDGFFDCADFDCSRNKACK
jgi:bacillopeptidase F